MLRLFKLSTRVRGIRLTKRYQGSCMLRERAGIESGFFFWCWLAVDGAKGILSVRKLI